MLRRASLVATLFVAALAPAARAQTPKSSVPSGAVVTAFVNVSVIPMDRERVLANQTVLVKDGRITALGAAKGVRVPAGAVRVDGHGKFLMPGLADMHVHLRDSAYNEESLWLFIANGITTVRDMHSGGRPERNVGVSSAPQAWLFALQRRVAAGEIVGPRLYTAGDPDKSSPAAAAASVVEMKADGHDFVKISDRTGADYDSVAAAAHRVGLRIVGHVPTDHPLDAILRDRWASIEHLTGYYEALLNFNPDGLFGQNLVRVVDTADWMRPTYHTDPARLRAVAEATRRAGVWNCPTAKQWLVFNQPDTTGRAMMRPTESRQSIPPDDSLPPQFRALRLVGRRLGEFEYWTVKALHDAGAGLLLGTDVGDATLTDVPPGFGVVRELQELVRAGLTPYQALETGTRNVATFLSRLDSAGTVAVGKRADLVLLDANPLADVGRVAGPAGVMVGGRWFPRAAIDAKLDSLRTWREFDLRGVRRVMWKAAAP